MDTLFPFKWRHFEGNVMPLCVRWYLRYALSYRAVEIRVGTGAIGRPNHRV
jgi:IS6 family transposase